VIEAVVTMELAEWSMYVRTCVQSGKTGIECPAKSVRLCWQACQIHNSIDLFSARTKEGSREDIPS